MFAFDFSTDAIKFCSLHLLLDSAMASGLIGYALDKFAGLLFLFEHRQ
jgi:hypothetical protein